MGAPDDWLYEYSMVRYVPRPERGEFINIGLIMMNKRKKWIRGKIFIHPNKIFMLNPRADIQNLRNQASLFENQDVPEKDLPVEEKYRWLAAVKSAALRVSPSHPGFVIKKGDNGELSDHEILDKEFNRLFEQLVL